MWFVDCGLSWGCRMPALHWGCWLLVEPCWLHDSEISFGRHPHPKAWQNRIVKRSGVADLPLHGGRVPPWLAARMVELGTAHRRERASITTGTASCCRA